MKKLLLDSTDHQGDYLITMFSKLLFLNRDHEIYHNEERFCDPLYELFYRLQGKGGSGGIRENLWDHLFLDKLLDSCLLSGGIIQTDVLPRQVTRERKKQVFA